MKNPNIKEEKALEENIELAKSFDAEIISVYDDIARQIAEYSSLSNVSKIVLGKNKDKKSLKKRFLKLLLKKHPILIYILLMKIKFLLLKYEVKKSFDFLGFLKITGVLLLATFIAFVFHKFNTQPSNMVMIFILAVFASSFISDNKIFAFYSSLVSVLIYNFFFFRTYF
ncbi:DUF4118 domain-containing protein [Campylobacter jejuni]